MGSYLSMVMKMFQVEQERTVMPFKNKQIEAIAKKFLLSPQDMIQFHHVFRKMDKLGNGYISEDNVFEFVEEEKTSVLSPYINKLFQLIEKENIDRVCFIEWVPAICAFCLFTHEQIIKFAFGMIDDDHDEVISKKDIIKFLVKERYGEKVFPFNQVRAIELLDVDRADRIKFEQFKRIEQQIPFICYPAFRLQEIFREQIKGKLFWKKIFQAIFQSEQEREKQKQQEIIDEQVNKKKNIELVKMEANFQQLTQNKKIEQNLFKPDFLVKTRESLQARTYEYCRESSLVRCVSHQNQDCIQIDYKSVVNPRRLSDGLIDIVFLAPSSTNNNNGNSNKQDQLIPILETGKTLRRVNSQLFIKSPFNSTASFVPDQAKPEDQPIQQQQQYGAMSKQGSPRNSHRLNINNNQQFMLNSPKNINDRQPNSGRNQFGYSSPTAIKQFIMKNTQQQQIQFKQHKVIPRSLKNTGNVLKPEKNNIQIARSPRNNNNNNIMNNNNNSSRNNNNNINVPGSPSKQQNPGI